MRESFFVIAISTPFMLLMWCAWYMALLNWGKVPQPGTAAGVVKKLRASIILDFRPGYQEPREFEVSLFRAALACFSTIVAFVLALVPTVWGHSSFSLAILGLLALLQPWIVLWMTYRIPGGPHSLQFRLYPVTWSYLMSFGMILCISANVGPREPAIAVIALFTEPKSPLLYALTGLFALAAIQVMLTDLKLPVPSQATETPIDWKKWMFTSSSIAWAHGVLMLLIARLGELPKG